MPNMLPSFALCVFVRPMFQICWPRCPRLLGGCLSFCPLLGWMLAAVSLAQAPAACKVLIVDRESGWPVPLIELRTTHQQRYISDNAGVIAITDPALMFQSVWFNVSGPGYQYPADGFGFHGVRLTPTPGGTLRVEVERVSIARRLGRLTGTGLFAESQQVGEQLDWRDGPVFGCDSVQLARHRGRLVWAWGDTTLGRYPLGVFHMSGAYTDPAGFTQLEPPLRPTFEFITDEQLRPRGLAPMPGPGPTWLTGFVSLMDQHGEAHLVALYRKIKPPLSVVEIGQCVWNDSREVFEPYRSLWQAPTDSQSPSGAAANTPPAFAAAPPGIFAEGHPSWYRDVSGQQWLMFGNPFPHVRLPATYEAWCDISQWQELEPQSELTALPEEQLIAPHSGSIAYNAFRQRWVTVFVQKFGQPSMLGSLWYAEADSPCGPWGPAVQILSHDNYTFYNPRLHPELETRQPQVLLFQGTYSAAFTRQAAPTPRWDYNQVLYRLDLDDPRLQAAQPSR